FGPFVFFDSSVGDFFSRAVFFAAKTPSLQLFNSIGDRTGVSCDAASFLVSFCAACSTSFGPESEKGVPCSLCLPEGVCTFFNAASLGLGNRPANETRAGHRR